LGDFDLLTIIFTESIYCHQVILKSSFEWQKMKRFTHGLAKVRPCIPNLNFWVGFRVGTSFSQFPKFEFNVIFLMFSESSEISIFRNLENITKIFAKIFEFLASENVIFGLIWTKNGKNWPFLVQYVASITVTSIL